MDNEIWESLKQFGIENKGKFPRVPWGSTLKGEGNLMYGIRGEDHPASKWLKNDATEGYFQRRNESVKKHWMNNEERKKTQSELMKEKWKNGTLSADQSRQNGNHGLKGKDVHNSTEIEYKGNTYYGWRDLKEATGVSKHLYDKYYVNGIDPEIRIGANGPAKG